MKIVSNRDSYADALSTASIAAIPFIAIGSLKHPAVYYISWTLCILFACLYFIRFAFTLRNDSSKRSEHLDNFMEIMQGPYVFSLAACFFMQAGYDMEPIFWLTLGFAVIGTVFSIFYNKEEL